MLDQVVRSLSSFSPDIDRLFLLVTILTGFWFIIAEVMFFWLILRFRAKPGVPATYLSDKDKTVQRWINIPHWLINGCDIVIIAAAVKVWTYVKQTLPPADATIRVTGQQWVWVFDHPGAEGQLGTADDIVTTDELHVEVGKTYHFLLESKDVLHSFSVPVFRLKQDAVPGRTITGWFKPTGTGTHDVQCAEMCGIGHGVMMARIFIESADQHTAWVQKHTPAAALAAAPDTTKQAVQ